MRYFLKQNVFDAALERIEYLFKEFPNVVVNFSGGKDSTVILFLSIMVAEKLNRLPVKVMFLDQEAEWQVVIDYVRKIMDDPRVEPRWLQVPFKLYNATSGDEPWLYCWEPGKEWIRDKEPDSIKENVYGTDRFAQLFVNFMEHEFNQEPGCCIAGVRCEESPSRHSALTSQVTYKDITWGNQFGKKYNQYTFYPLYDWIYKDVWKAIHENKWPYCKIYDYMYQHGIEVRKMRVSSVIHETALNTLTYMQEIEQENWNRITRRLSGLNTVKHLQKDFFIPKELPWMFRSWKEYRDHLAENLIVDPDIKKKMKKRFKRDMELYVPEIHEKLIKMHIASIMVNDWEGIKSGTFRSSHSRFLRNSKYQKGQDKWIS
jgi:predicted phosphoadenosine phosphosulfate sulfurtransferase